jgi:hypothetical protein
MKSVPAGNTKNSSFTNFPANAGEMVHFTPPPPPMYSVDFTKSHAICGAFAVKANLFAAIPQEFPVFTKFSPVIITIFIVLTSISRVNIIISGRPLGADGFCPHSVTKVLPVKRLCINFYDGETRKEFL